MQKFLQKKKNINTLLSVCVRHRARRRPVSLSDWRVSRAEASDSGPGTGRLGDPTGLSETGHQTGPGLLRRGLDG